MEDAHDTAEVLSVDQHAARRWRESRDPGPGEAEAPVIRTSEAVPGEPGEEADFTSIVLPVDSKERRVLLRRAGVAEIDVREKEECRELRVSRQTCGCTCQLYCLPDTCPCAKVRKMHWVNILWNIEARQLLLSIHIESLFHYLFARYSSLWTRCNFDIAF